MFTKKIILSFIFVICMSSFSSAQQKLSTAGVTMGQSKQQVATVIKSKGDNYKEFQKDGIYYISIEDINLGDVIFDAQSYFKFNNDQLYEVFYQMDNAIGTAQFDPAGFAVAKIKAQKINNAYNKLVNSLIVKYGNPVAITGSSTTRKYITWHMHNGTITLEYHYKSGYDNAMYPCSETISAGLVLKYVDASININDL